MTPADAVLTLLGIALVLLPAAGFAIWLAGTRLIGRRRPTPRLAPEELAPLAQLDLVGLATSREIEALSPRERQFVSRSIGSRLHGRIAAMPPAPERGGAAAATAAAQARPAEREVPIAAFILVCPACGASLGTAADVAHYVGSCPSCSRRVSSRRRGSRVALNAGDQTVSRD